MRDGIVRVELAGGDNPLKTSSVQQQGPIAYTCANRFTVFLSCDSFRDRKLVSFSSIEPYERKPVFLLSFSKYWSNLPTVSSEKRFWSQKASRGDNSLLRSTKHMRERWNPFSVISINVKSVTNFQSSSVMCGTTFHGNSHCSGQPTSSVMHRQGENKMHADMQIIFFAFHEELLSLIYMQEYCLFSNIDLTLIMISILFSRCGYSTRSCDVDR